MKKLFSIFATLSVVMILSSCFGDGKSTSTPKDSEAETEVSEEVNAEAEEAVKAVKDGDWVDYSQTCSFPQALDKALAARSGELHDVKIRNAITMLPVATVENVSRIWFMPNTRNEPTHCIRIDGKPIL